MRRYLLFVLALGATLVRATDIVATSPADVLAENATMAENAAGEEVRSLLAVLGQHSCMCCFIVIEMHDCLNVSATELTSNMAACTRCN